MLYEENPKMCEIMFERDEYLYLYEKELKHNKVLIETIKAKNERIKELEEILINTTNGKLEYYKEKIIDLICNMFEEEED